MHVDRIDRLVGWLENPLDREDIAETLREDALRSVMEDAPPRYQRPFAVTGREVRRSSTYSEAGE